MRRGKRCDQLMRESRAREAVLGRVNVIMAGRARNHGGRGGRRGARGGRGTGGVQRGGRPREVKGGRRTASERAEEEIRGAKRVS